MTTQILRPLRTGGVCLTDINWQAVGGYAYGSPGPCPASLWISADDPEAYWPDTGEMYVNFNGRGWNKSYASGCPTAVTTDQYIEFPGGRIDEAQVDVWRAYADNVWSSSCTIEIKRLAFFTFNSVLHAWRNHWSVPSSDPLKVTKSIATSGGYFGDCPSATIRATITVNDDGTFSVA